MPVDTTGARYAVSVPKNDDGGRRLVDLTPPRESKAYPTVDRIRYRIADRDQERQSGKGPTEVDDTYWGKWPENDKTDIATLPELTVPPYQPNANVQKVIEGLFQRFTGHESKTCPGRLAESKPEYKEKESSTPVARKIEATVLDLH